MLEAMTSEATMWSLLQAAEYILAGGNERVILCERGIRTFETDSRATLDVAGIAALENDPTYRCWPIPAMPPGGGNWWLRWRWRRQLPGRTD